LLPTHPAAHESG